ncbi:MAG: putative manganese transporter [Eubacteriales bacterium]|nr:putative manganese transporter [Eubacteriales bacterium]
MADVILDSVLDIIKTVPILFVVYFVVGWLETRADAVTRVVTTAEPLSPLIGALVGAIPQCGFSVGCSALYCRRFLGPAALIAVFLSTSDEAIPVLLANGAEQWKTVLLLLAVKLVVAIVAGYFFYFFVFRTRLSEMDLPDEELDTEEIDVSCNCVECSGGSLLGFAISRTVTTCLYLLVTMVILNLIVYAVGTDTLSKFLLNGTIFQPVLCALIGLIPGCAVSVLLTELFVSGAISFGGAIAGLSAGAGFGFLLLFTDAPDRREAMKIIACTYLAAVAAGVILQLLL